MEQKAHLLGRDRVVRLRRPGALRRWRAGGGAEHHRHELDGALREAACDGGALRSRRCRFPPSGFGSEATWD
jgi:hypothetical protein